MYSETPPLPPPRHSPFTFFIPPPRPLSPLNSSSLSLAPPSIPPSFSLSPRSAAHLSFIGTPPPDSRSIIIKIHPPWFSCKIFNLHRGKRKKRKKEKKLGVVWWEGRGKRKRKKERGYNWKRTRKPLWSCGPTAVLASCASWPRGRRGSDNKHRCRVPTCRRHTAPNENAAGKENVSKRGGDFRAVHPACFLPTAKKITGLLGK